MSILGLDQDDDWYPPSTAQMSKNTRQLRCTSPERVEKLLEIEKAAKWYRAWHQATDKWFEEYAKHADDFAPGSESMKADRRTDTCDSKRLKAYERLMRLVS